MHGGNKAIEAQNRESVRNYRLTKWENRVRDFAKSGGVKSLREEIGILRMVLEETINKCENNVDLLLYAHKISDLVLKIEKLVSSCHRLENSMGMLLDKSAALHLAGQIVEIIGNHITDSDIVDNVANDIARVLLNIEET